MHAASLGNVDLNVARRHFIETLADENVSTFDRSTALLHGLWIIERDARDMKAMTEFYGRLGLDIGETLPEWGEPQILLVKDLPAGREQPALPG